MLKKYSASLDKLLQSAAYAKEGKHEKAAKAMADALDQDDYQQTMEALDEQQNLMFDQQDEQFDQQDFAKVLSRVTANKESVLAGDDDENADSASDTKEEDAGAGFDDTGDDAEDVKVEHAEADDEGKDESETDASVMPSVAARLNAREERAAANKKALASKAKTKK